MHDVEFEHFHATPEEAQRLSEAIWRVDNVLLTTVGIDIGSSTSHFMISRVHLQRAANNLSSHFIVVGRDEVWRSPVILTPYKDDYSIDASELDAFVRRGYADAGLKPSDIDTGAVILTGEALKRRNARAIADLFAADSGRFVCASAGHHLEGMLAAQGSGAVALSRQHKKTVLNIDIGGGTTKFALVRDGGILSTAAVAVGGRLVVCNRGGHIVRLEEPARKLARSLGLDLRLGSKLTDDSRRTLVRSMREIIIACARQDAPSGVAVQLMLTEPLADSPKPEVVTFSGGVAEFLFGREKEEFGDLGPSLARSIQHSLGHHALAAQIWDPGHGIRATVVGASQFTVQVSGSTIHLTAPERLPLSNLPVVYCPLELSSETLEADAIARTITGALRRHDLNRGKSMVALAFRWVGTPSHQRLYAVADAIARSLRLTTGPDILAVLLIDGDVGGTLGRILSHEVAPGTNVISIDGLQLRDFDYVDIGEKIMPAGVVPVIIKSLLFPSGAN